MYAVAPGLRRLPKKLAYYVVPKIAFHAKRALAGGVQEALTISLPPKTTLCRCEENATRFAVMLTLSLGAARRDTDMHVDPNSSTRIATKWSSFGAAGSELEPTALNKKPFRCYRREDPAMVRP